MAWYRAGTVAVTNGSAAVTGTGTDFVANVAIGDSFQGPDGRAYEVAGVVSATQLTLAVGYMGATAAGQGYSIQPTQSFARDLALAATSLIASFAAVRDGIGAGLIADGTAAAPGIRFAADQDTGFFRADNNTMALITGGAEVLRLTAAGLLLVGATAGTSHIVARGTAENDWVFYVSGLNNPSTRFYSGTAGWNASAAVQMVAKNSTTNRSMNAAGTVNASGADYAEYMTKAEGCGPIAAGDVCGVDRDGKLTRTWGDAVSFVIKSTDPAYVGGDSWAPPQPEQYEDEPEGAFAVRLAAWEVALEAARKTVDRIAFCGQVPVNVSGECAVGDYLIAAASGGGIRAVAVAADDIAFDQYRRRLGRVWGIREGRPIIDVQHG